MVKKLQALRAKKGFTLVELIVVIAIIGVLAAILVPTMMGMVTKSRVTSVDQTASTIGQSVSTWMMNLDTEGGKVSSTGKITISAGGTAAAGAGGGVFGLLSESGKSGSGTSSASATSGKVTVTIAEGTFSRADTTKSAAEMLAKQIDDDYNFGTKTGHATVYIKDRKVIGTVYYEGPEVENIPGVTNFENGTYGWGSQDGVTTDGTTIGTNPKLTSGGETEDEDE